MSTPFKLHRWWCTKLALSAAVVVLVAAIVVVGGCGGTTTTTTAAPITTTTKKAAGEGPVGEQLTATDETPTELSQALTTKTPVVILVYVAGGAEDESVRRALAKIDPKYPDVTFLMYNYNNPKEYGDIARLLGVQYPPFAAFIDKNNVVRYLTTGYVDEAVMNQYVVNIRQL